MSKIGKLPIIIPEGVKVTRDGHVVSVCGPKGSLSYQISREADIEISDGKIVVLSKNETKAQKENYGTTRARIFNIVYGVVNGWKKELELVGTGFRAEVSGRDLILTVGYSHTVTITAPEGITFKVEKTFITVSGPDKEVVGETAAKIRAVRPPEPYKGKGIKYKDEVIRRKAGKAAKAAGAA
jgi:large subunit ribosomal protein L6